MPDSSILTERCRERMAALNAADQLAATRADLTPDQHIQLVQHLLTERRKRQQPVATERRGRHPQRHGWEDQSDIATAFDADRATDSPTKD